MYGVCTHITGTGGNILLGKIVGNFMNHNHDTNKKLEIELLYSSEKYNQINKFAHNH